MGKYLKFIIPALALIVGGAIGFFVQGQMCCSGKCMCAALNGTYTIAGEPVTLKGGVAVSERADGGPGTLTKIENLPVRGDLDGDGRDELVVILTQDKGDGAVMYYVSAISGATGKPMDTLPLGDRVVVRNIDTSDDCIWLTMLTHKQGQNPATPPTKEITRQYTSRDGLLIEI